MRCTFRLLILAILLSAALASGCSSGKGGKVKGRVLLDGKPLADAQVVFHLKDAAAAANQAITDAEGNFLVQPDAAGRTLSPGSYVVYITKYVQKDGTVPSAEDLDMQIASGTLRNVVPSRYGPPSTEADTTATSPLTADIHNGDNDLPPFELKSR